jgi:hypothetical protein
MDTNAIEDILIFASTCELPDFERGCNTIRATTENQDFAFEFSFPCVSRQRKAVRTVDAVKLN